MTEMIVADGIIIDDAESVLQSIRNLCGIQVSDLEVVKKFINSEKNTKFYLDKNLNSQTNYNKDSVYLWLDTGFRDQRGGPVQISLLHSSKGFIGHVVGAISFLMRSAKDFFKIRQNIADQKLEAFRKKYNSKANERNVTHITDERTYLMKECVLEEGSTELAKKIQALAVEFDREEEKEDIVIVEDISKTEQLTEAEEEITIGLLLEKMEGMQSYVNELLRMLETVNQESQEKIQELRKKNTEYERVILQMRGFLEQEKMYQNKNYGEDEAICHNLLGNHNKILVIGGKNLGVNVMQGIAKDVGFEKQDFEFVDYDKAKSFTERIRTEGKYRAIIIGACPHKTRNSGAYSSPVEMFKRTEGMPYTADARSKTGKLKVTKQSFREALMDVYTYLREAEYAG